MSSGNCRVGGKPSTAGASAACASASRLAARYSFARASAAQFEAARFLRLRDRDRGLQRLLGRRGIGRVALQQDLAADAVHFGFVITGLSGLQLGERAVEAPEPGINLRGTRFGFGQGRFEGQEPDPSLLRRNGEAASHLGESRLFGTIGPLCPAPKKYRQAGPEGWEIVSRHDIGQRLAVGRGCFGVAAKKRKQRRESERITDCRTMRRRPGVGEGAVDKR